MKFWHKSGIRASILAYPTAPWASRELPGELSMLLESAGRIGLGDSDILGLREHRSRHTRKARTLWN